MSFMHGYRTADLAEVLARQDIHRSETHIDNAIQSAIEALTSRDGFRPNPENDRGWWEIEPHALYFLDLEMDEEGTLYELEGAR